MRQLYAERRAALVDALVRHVRPTLGIDMERHGMHLLEGLERERAACAPGARAGEQQWEGRGVVRAVYPQLLVITHEEIRGLLPARTTSFRAASLTLRDSIRVGDPIRFSLRGTVADDATLVALERWRDARELALESCVVLLPGGRAGVQLRTGRGI